MKANTVMENIEEFGYNETAKTNLQKLLKFN